MGSEAGEGDAARRDRGARASDPLLPREAPLPPFPTFRRHPTPFRGRAMVDVGQHGRRGGDASDGVRAGEFGVDELFSEL